LTSETFIKTLRRCVASWHLLKSEAKSQGIDVHRVLQEWSVSEDRLRDKEASIEPYEFQEEIYEKLERLSERGGLLVVEAPTASGKTEAAAATFFSQWVKGDEWLAPRLIYTLPTRALTMTAYARLSSYSKGIASMLGTKPLCATFEYGSTFAAKHYLYGGPIVASTFDAVAYGYVALRVPGRLKNPRLSFPTALLATSLLVLDEVQLYQDKHYYSPAIIGMLLRPLIIAGAVVVIMSATLPTLLLRELAGNVKYEHVTSGHTERGEVKVDVDYLKSGKKLPDTLGEEEVTKLIDEALRSGSVLIVVNTVRRAVECYRSLKKRYADRVLLLHSKMTNADREEREKRLFRENLIVVSTQVVEAGFDFDANLMLTELAPLDSLIQRAGRVARLKGTEGRVLVFDITSPEPYVSELIEATRSLLRETDGQALRDSLYDVEAARENLDKVYTEPLVNQLKAESERSLLEAEAYLRSLRLFSSPPEEDFRLREGFYMTVIVPEVYGRLLQRQNNLPQEVLSKFSELLRRFELPSKEAAIDFSYEELQPLLQLLEQASLSLGSEELPRSTARRQLKKRGKREKKSEEATLLAARLSLRKVREEARAYRVALRPYKEVQGVKPFGIYVLRTGYYSEEEGFIAREAT
jgi:CRISPR-associated endonuclease/helicase Cas3